MSPLSSVYWKESAMSELLSLHPLEQAALPLLRQIQVPNQPGVSPLVQLAQWALRQGKHHLWPHLVGPQSRALESLAAWPSEDLLKFLLRPRENDHPGLADALVPEDLAGLQPEEAGQVLLNQLHDQLQQYDPAYPPPSHLQAALPKE